MPDYYSRLNLASAIFPFYTEASGRTIMIPQLDENWDRYNAANTVQDKGVPQVFYMHNVVPIAGGFQSVGYIQQIAGLTNHTDFDLAFPLFNSDLSRFIFVPASGANYIYDADVGNWASVSPLPANVVNSTTLVTTAFVQGVTYIFYSGYGCYTYNDTTKTLTSVSLTGLTISNILGICAANGYMIAWSSTTIAWSSLTDPTNFIPSVQTGAGGGSVNEAKGGIKFCLSISGGFLIYCGKNVVGASFTNNTTQPYLFLEVPNSDAVQGPNQVSWQSNLQNHIAITASGMQSINLSSAQTIMPEVSDFLAAQLFEDFNETTLQFTSTFLGNQLYSKITAVGDRFIILSYGQNSGMYTHAILYDNMLNRYGKLKINHVDCFNWNSPVPYGHITYNQLLNTPIYQLAGVTYYQLSTSFTVVTLPKKTIAFLQLNGTVQTVDFEIGETSADGVFIIGKFQLQRNEIFQHQTTDVETVASGATFSFYLLPSFDGKDFSAAVPTVTNQTNNYVRTFAKRYSAFNISYILIGAFNLTSIVTRFTVGGWR